ncbi:MAG TPA: HAD family hydrolase [Anaerolineales bacterium]|nr:HAD family hydrolase [Anaerolineales bacterium]
MNRFIRAVLFDLGSTLMYARDPWAPIEAKADQALTERLQAQGVNVSSSFAKEFRARLAEYYAQREQNLFETSYLSVVREMLSERSYPNLPEAVIRSALDALFAVTQKNWQIEDDALLTLRVLESGGYHLGLVSNAGDSKDVFQLVERFRIEPFFDFVLTSAACSYRKPHPRIFELALAHWALPAREIAMVGDLLNADILGAQKVGLYAIWIKRRAKASPEELASIHPDASVDRLDQIPHLLSELWK